MKVNLATLCGGWKDLGNPLASMVHHAFTIPAPLSFFESHPAAEASLGGRTRPGVLATGTIRPAVGLKQGRLYHWFCRATCKQAVAPDGTFGNSVHPIQFAGFSTLAQLFCRALLLQIQHPMTGIVGPEQVRVSAVRGNALAL